jgi:hypothetical protein
MDKADVPLIIPPREIRSLCVTHLDHSDTIVAAI